MRMWRVLSVALLLGMAGWGTWLLGQSRRPADYVVARVDGTRPLRPCTWVASNSDRIESLGLSIAADHSWTDRTTAWVALPAPALPRGGVLELTIAGVAADDVIIDAEGARTRVRVTAPGTVRLALTPRAAPGALLVTLRADDPKPPTGQDRRWLGIALQRLRICPV